MANQNKKEDSAVTILSGLILEFLKFHAHQVFITTSKMYGDIPSVCWLIILIWLGVQARWFGGKQWTYSRQNGGLWWDWILQHTLMEGHGKIHTSMQLRYGKISQ